MTDTKDKILDAAEKSLAQHGFAGTSVRGVIADAGVNLAAVHYHFGSKEELLRAVIQRRAEPVNRDRLALLEEFERQAGSNPVPLERVLEAFIAPTLRVASQPGGPQFIRVLGRLYAESDLLPRIIKSDFAELLHRFLTALSRALPELSEEELYCRIYLAVGVVAHGMRGIHELGGLTHGLSSDLSMVQDRLIAFISAGFRSRSKS